MSERREDEQELKIEIKEFIAENRQWKLSTDEYRKTLCGKIDDINIKIEDINKRIYKLPCDSRLSIYESIDNKIKIIWGVLVLVLGAIITQFFRRP